MSQNEQHTAGLFSVILLHYNQQRYLETSLQSIFLQTFPKIELIFADDGTANLDVEGIKTYIKAHQPDNIKNVIYQISETNCGTVKTVNQAIQAASGDYILFFAADDALYDAQTLFKYAAALDNLPEDEGVVAAQCHMMDENLDGLISPFVNEALAFSLNTASSQEQYSKLVSSCLYAIGATAFRPQVWKKYGYFDETYKIIEDWSFYLRLTRMGGKIAYNDFVGLKHRDGGVSHFNQTSLPPHVIEYKNDSLLIQEREIIPYLSMLPRSQQLEVLERYDQERTAFSTLHSGKKRIKRISIVKNNKGLFVRKGIWWMMGKASDYRQHLAKLLPKLLVSWVALGVLQLLAGITGSTVWGKVTGSICFYVLLICCCGLFAVVLICYLLMAALSFLVFLREKRRNYFSEER